MWVYHSGPEKLCERHIVARRVDGANRRGAELRALPSWADKERIAAVYREARYVEKLTGKPQHVDHIIPLKGRKVCGLHVAENLQVLSAQENARKGNRYSA